MKTKFSATNKWITILSSILILFGLYLISFYNYLLFHSIVEVFIIVIACGIFILVWNSLRFLDNGYLLFIGISYLFIAFLELIHALAYGGMGVFSREYGANLSTQMWIAARYMESLSLLIAPLFLTRSVRLKLLLVCYTSMTCLILLSVFLWDIFPVCFVEGTGLTAFKKISEYIICLILIGSIAHLLQKRNEFEPNVYQFLITSIFLKIVAELAFTLYADIYSFINIIGHYLTIISFYLIYKAIIETSLIKPYDLLFRNLTQTKEEIKKSRDELAMRVKERTAELEKRTEQMSRLSSEVTLAEQKERSRIAKILHDHLQQLLVGAKINQEILMDHIGDMPKAMAQRVLDLINQSIHETRNLNTELVPTILISGELSSSVESLGQWMKENQGFEVKVDSGAHIVLDRQDLAILLFQSIRELLLNALKHSGVKSASVKIDRQNERLHVVVSDQGKGFDTVNLWEGGNWMGKSGLISIRERLLYLGGHLNVESGPNQGSTFSMTVPMDREKSSGISKAVDLRSDMPENFKTRLDFMERVSGIIRVMLVDDHPVVREGLSRMFDTFQDIEVVAEAADGQEAIKLAREIVPDVILMDISLPKIDGLQATRIIHAELPNIRIIGLSMYDESNQAKAMLDAGAKVYLSKSGNTDRLIAAIRGEDQY